MKILWWILLIAIIIFVAFYTYDYFTIPKLGDIKTTNSCIDEVDRETFGLFAKKEYSIFIPKDWPFANLSSGQPRNTYSFLINKDDPYEFFSIWCGEYNKTAENLAFETLKGVSNYKIDIQRPVETGTNESLLETKITFNTEEGEFKQNTYTFVKDQKGFVLVFRFRNHNDNLYTPIINKMICSFNPY